MPENKFLFNIPKDLLNEEKERVIKMSEESKKLEDSFLHKSPVEKQELHNTAYFSKRYNYTERSRLAKKLLGLRKEERRLKLEEVTELDIHIGEEKREEIIAVLDTLYTNEARKKLDMPLDRKSTELQTRMSETINNDTFLVRQREMLSEFHAGQNKEREAFVAEQKARSVTELSKDSNLFFIHTLDMKSPRDARCLIAMSPTICTSTVSKEKDSAHDTFGRMGFVLAEGTVLGAHDHDVDSTSTYDGKRYISGIQKTIVSSPEEIQSTITAKNFRTGHNELFVERPVIKSFYFDLDSLSTFTELKEMGFQIPNRELSHSEILGWRDALCDKLGIPKVSIIVRWHGEMQEIKDGSEIDALRPTPEKRKEILNDLFNDSKIRN